MFWGTPIACAGLRDEVVEQLAEPVEASGLIEPIVVRPRKVGPYLAAVET
jgi:ParB-like chromosome segregation protein Spo0J